MGFLSAADLAGIRGTLDLVANCHLTAIARPGTVDAYGDPAATDSLWSGSAPGYLERSHAEGTVRLTGTGSGVNGAPAVVNAPEWRTTLTVLLDAVGVLAEAGTAWNELTVTVSDERVTPPVARTYHVLEATDVAYGVLDSVTLVLADEAAS